MLLFDWLWCLPSGNGVLTLMRLRGLKGNEETSFSQPFPFLSDVPLRARLPNFPSYSGELAGADRTYMQMSFAAPRIPAPLPSSELQETGSLGLRVLGREYPAPPPLPPHRLWFAQTQVPMPPSYLLVLLPGLGLGLAGSCGSVVAHLDVGGSGRGPTLPASRSTAMPGAPRASAPSCSWGRGTGRGVPREE